MSTPIFLAGGAVTLEDSMADDLSVVNSARVSFGKRRTEIDTRDVELIDYLLGNKHGTPFEHNSFRFHVQAPIFVTREWMRHRIGSFNEFSMRYAIWEPRFFVPRPLEVRSRIGKPGDYTYVQADQETARRWVERVCELFELCAREYEWGLAHNIAPEHARIVLPVAAFTEFFWTVNARSLMNFLALRNAPAALKEIRDYAEVMEAIFAEKMPHTHAAFVRHGRTAP